MLSVSIVEVLRQGEAEALPRLRAECAMEQDKIHSLGLLACFDCFWHVWALPFFLMHI